MVGQFVWTAKPQPLLQHLRIDRVRITTEILVLHVEKIEEDTIWKLA